MICSCGDAKPHVVARRVTADDAPIVLWENGALTWGSLGHFVKGSARPRTGEQSRLALRAGRLVLGDVFLYDATEVPVLVSAARWTAERDGLPGTMRGRFKALTAPRGLVPRWTIEQTDRDGKATSRWWVLPRMLDGTLAVLHEGGLYRVMRRTRSASFLRCGRGDDFTFEPTGIEFKTQRELLRVLPSLFARHAGNPGSRASDEATP